VTLVALVVNGWLEPWGEAAYQREIQGFLYARPPAATQIDAAFAIDGVGTFFAGRLRADRDDATRAELSGVLVVLADGRTVTAPRGAWDAITRTWALEGARVTPPGADAGRAESGPLTLAFPLESTPEQALMRPALQTLTQLVARVATCATPAATSPRRASPCTGAWPTPRARPCSRWRPGALALRVRGRAAGLGWTIALVVAFWASWTLTGTLFDQGVLGALGAAWATPAAVAAAGVGLAWWVARDEHLGPRDRPRDRAAVRLGLMVLTLLLLLSFLLDVLADVVARGVPAGTVAAFLLLKLPSAAAAGLPLALLFAALLALSRATQDGELRAALQLGISPVATVRPILAVGAAVALLTLANNEIVVPWAEQRALEVQREILLRSPGDRAAQRRLLPGRARPLDLPAAVTPDGVLEGITVIAPGGSQGPRQLIEAARGVADPARACGASRTCGCARSARAARCSTCAPRRPSCRSAA
jgi:lipopolysaccharide export LptBFGC system permease protein LptF